MSGEMSGLTHAAMLDASPIPTSVVDAEGTVVYVNDAFLEYASRARGVEVRREDRIGRNVREFTVGGFGYSREEWLAFYDRILEKGESFSHAELGWQPSPDREMYVDVRMDPIIGQEGEVAGAVLAWQDVTDRVRMRKRELLRAALDRVRVSVYEMRETEDMQRVLASLYRALKDSGVEFENCSISLVDEEKGHFQGRFIDTEQVYPTETLPLRDTPVYRAWREGRVIYRRNLDDDDEYNERGRLVEYAGIPIRSVLDVPFSHGTIAVNHTRPDAFTEEDVELLRGFAEVLSEGYTRFEDMQKIEQSAEALREREERYRLLFETISDAIMVFDAETGQFVDVNSAAQSLYGYTRDEFLALGQPVITAQPDASRDSIKQTLSGKLARVPLRYHRRKDGTVFPVEIAANMFTLGGRRLLCGVIRDITERRQAEEVLRESEERFRTTFESAPIGMDIVDAKGRPIRVNRAFQDMLGYTEDEFRSMAFTEYTHPDDIEASLALTRKLLEGESSMLQMEKRYYRKDGRVVWGNTTVSAVRDPDGAFQYFIAMVEDITARKEMSENLHNALDSVNQQREQLRALRARLSEVEEGERQRLARELHDRVGQNLTALSLSLNLVQSYLPAESAEQTTERLEDTLSLVEETVERVRDVMAELRPVVLDDYGLLAALRWYGERFSKRTGVDVLVEGEELAVRLPSESETELFRIYQEALTNVGKHARAQEEVVTLEERDGGLRMCVEDDGIGFDPETLHPAGALSGWGLVSMRERALAIGGRLEVDAEEERGTRVVVEVEQ